VASVLEHKDYYLDPRRDVRAYVGGSGWQTARTIIPNTNISSSTSSLTS